MSETESAKPAALKPTALKSTAVIGSSVQSDTSNNWSLESGSIPDVDAELERLRGLGQQLDQALQRNQSHEAPPELPVLGSFKILRPLGSGGCGIVYLADDPELKRKVAIKVPHASLFVQKAEQDRFMQEAKIVAVLAHPNIVEIHQVGNDHNRRYLVFEYCSGGSLADWLARQTGPLAPRLCAKIVLSLARAVEYAHQLHIVHRDVNPRNVLLSPDSGAHAGEHQASFPFIPKLSDFGLGTWLDEHHTAVRTQTGAVLGTLAYMAPEQTRGDGTSQLPPVDIYALGVMLYELLAGVRPFVGATPVETLRMIREADPVSPRVHQRSISRDLETICLKCLEKAPAQRYATAKLLAEDLESYLAGNSIRARPPTTLEKSARWVAKRRLPLSLALGALLVVGLFFIRSSWLAQELQASRGNEAELKQQSAIHANLVAEAQSEQIDLRSKARAQSAQVQRLSYFDELQLISDAVSTRPFDAIRMLRNWIPKPGESDQRGFEWYYLLHECGGDIALFPPPAEIDLGAFVQMRLSSDGRCVYVLVPHLTHPRIWGWDTVTGKALKSITHFDGLAPIDFEISHDGKHRLIAMRNDSIILGENLTDTSQRWQLRPSNLKDFTVTHMKAHPNRAEVLSILAGTQNGSHANALAWTDLSKNGKSKTITWPNARVSDVVVNPVDDSTVVAVNNSIEVYGKDRIRSQELRISDQSPIHSLAISRDGGQLAISTDRQQIYLFRKDDHQHWKLVEKAPWLVPVFIHGNGSTSPQCHSIHFDYSGQHLYYTHNDSMAMDAISPAGQLLARSQFSDAKIRQVQPLGDGSMAAWISEYQCGLWKPTPQLVPLDGHSKEAWAVAYSHQGDQLATVSDDETSRFWNPKTGDLWAELKGHTATLSCVAYSHDDSRIATGGLDGIVTIWDAKNHVHLASYIGVETQIRSIAWFADAKRLAISDSPRGSKINRLVVWNSDSRQVEYSFHGFTDRIQSVLVTPDQQHVIGVSDDSTIRQFHLGAHSETDVPSMQWSTGEPMRCGILVDQGRTLVTGNNKGDVCTWDVESGSEVRRVSAHQGSVICLQLSPDGKVLASGGIDKTIYLWDMESGRRLLTIRDLPAQVNGLAFAPAGDVLTAAFHDGSLRHFYAPKIEPIQFDSE